MKAELDLKLDPIAIAALVLSLIAAGASLIAWWRGPSVRLISPDRVALYSDVAPSGSTFVRIAAPMSYANVAQEPYGDVVLVERAALTVGGLETHQRWNAFGEIGTNKVQSTGTATPQSLPGQSASTHFTLFTAVPRDCPEGSTVCDPMAEYLSLKKFSESVGTARELRFKFQIDLINAKPQVTECVVPLTKLVRQKLAELERVPFYAMCRQRSAV
jgi:hypothetical protein